MRSPHPVEQPRPAVSDIGNMPLRQSDRRRSALTGDERPVGKQRRDMLVSGVLGKVAPKFDIGIQTGLNSPEYLDDRLVAVGDITIALFPAEQSRRRNYGPGERLRVRRLP